MEQIVGMPLSTSYAKYLLGLGYFDHVKPSTTRRGLTSKSVSSKITSKNVPNYSISGSAPLKIGIDHHKIGKWLGYGRIIGQYNHPCLNMCADNIKRGSFHSYEESTP